MHPCVDIWDHLVGWSVCCQRRDACVAVLVWCLQQHSGKTFAARCKGAFLLNKVSDALFKHFFVPFTCYSHRMYIQFIIQLESCTFTIFIFKFPFAGTPNLHRSVLFRQKGFKRFLLLYNYVLDKLR